MDFFGAQDVARRRSGWLLALFALAVGLIALTVYLALALVLSAQEPTGWWRPGLFGATVGGVFVLVGLCSAMRSRSLRSGGGGAVAELLGGRLVPPNPTSPADLRFRNVVEEMALAAGVSVPAIYVLENESGINAFAAGYSTEDAVVAVTRGALDRFTREELQGVVAHEFSHILNRDIRLNIRLTGLLFGILALGLGGRILLQSGAGFRGGRNGGQAAVVAVALGLVLFLAGYAGVFFGRVIRAAVSRQREFLADAAAVQFTRNPSGLASALEKVRTAGSQLHTAGAEEMSHFFFANGLRQSFVTGLWSTHPPLEERIRRLDASFLGTGMGPAEAVRPSDSEEDLSADVRTAGLAPAVVRSAPPPPEVGAARLGALSEPLLAAIHDPFSAVALTYALMLDPDASARGLQRAALSAEVSEPLLREINRLQPYVDVLPLAGRLALVDLASPAYRQLSLTQSKKLGRVLGEVARADRRLSLFEFALEAAVCHRLIATHGHADRRRRATLGDVLPHATVLLSALAHSGQNHPDEVQAALAVGLRSLLGRGGHSRPVAATGRDVVQALNILTEARYDVRRRLITACARTVLHDRVVTSNEAFLLHAIAAALDVPPPDFLPRFNGAGEMVEDTG